MVRRRKKTTYPHPTNKPHYKNISLKEQKFVDHFTKTGKQNESARVALPHIKESSVPKMGHELSTRPAVQKAIILELDKRGLNDDKVSEVLNDAVRAEKQIKDYVDGSVDVVPDHSIRLNAIKEVNKLKGNYPDKRVEVNKHQSNLNLTITAQMTKTQLDAQLKKLQSRLDSTE